MYNLLTVCFGLDGHPISIIACRSSSCITDLKTTLKSIKCKEMAAVSHIFAWPWMENNWMNDNGQQLKRLLVFSNKEEQRAMSLQ